MTDANEREARRIGRLALPAALSVMVSTVLDKAAPLSQRLRAAENLCDRLGMPRRMESDVASVHTEIDFDSATFFKERIELIAERLGAALPGAQPAALPTLPNGAEAHDTDR